MRMKKYAITILFLFIFLQIKATGQSGDVLYIEGEKWDLMAKPIDADSTLYARLRDFLPKNHCMTTANWSGYTAFWEIRNDRLYLQRLDICIYDRGSQKDSTLIFEADLLQTLFAPYYKHGEIYARWFSGELRAGQGNLVRYVHSGFNRNMETERVMTLKDGKVVHAALYHNYRKSGLNLYDAQTEIIKRFPWRKFPEYQGQRLIFSIAHFRMTEDGRLLDFDVSAVFIRPMKEKIEDAGHPLIKAFKETLKSIYPWEVLYINGKYTVEYPYFVMPIQEKKRVNETRESDTSAFRL